MEIEKWYTFLHYAGSCLIAHSVNAPKVYKRYIDSYPICLQDAYDALKESYE